METGATAPVARSMHGDILVVTIDNPPVNALGVDVRRALVEAIEAADGDAAVKAVLLTGSGNLAVNATSAITLTNGANDYSGTTTVTGGTLRAGVANAIDDSSLVIGAADHQGPLDDSFN